MDKSRKNYILIDYKTVIVFEWLPTMKMKKDQEGKTICKTEKESSERKKRKNVLVM